MSRQLNTIIAALRFYQEEFGEGDNLSDDLLDIATNGGEESPVMSAAEIDELCEALNMGDLVIVKPDETAEAKIDEAHTAASETQPSWGWRFSRVMSALGFDYGDPDEIDRQIYAEKVAEIAELRSSLGLTEKAS